jgi:enoyl-CoA hydratase
MPASRVSSVSISRARRICSTPRDLERSESLDGFSARRHVAGSDIRTLTAFAALDSSAIRRGIPGERAAAIRQSASKGKSETVRIEKNGAVWTVCTIVPRLQRNGPGKRRVLTAPFSNSTPTRAPRSRSSTAPAEHSCRLGSQHVSTQPEHPLGELDILTAGPHVNGEIPRGPMGPSRLELDKPVIAAIEGPAVAGGMELGLWCDFRVMAEDSYFGVYCRRWGVPLIDGGTVRLPRIVGQGRALEIILTGRKVPAQECLSIGLCEYVTPKGGARAKAEELAQQIARFPQVCVRADRRSAIRSHGLTVREALIQEWYNGRRALIEDGVAGATRFKDGLGRHGDFERIR